MVDYEDSFWSRIRRQPEGCWEWQSTFQPNGYGKMCIRYVFRYAHRLAYEYANGPIPDGMLVCHTCDNRACCRPSHLWLGTTQENELDSQKKGRSKLNHPETIARRVATRLAKPNCRRGHPFDGVNCQGKRQCSTCQAIRDGKIEHL